MSTREIPADVAETVQTAREMMLDGQAKIERAAKVIRNTAKQLAGEGWTQIDIAGALGLSKQRVSQLVNAPKKPVKG